MNNDNESFKQLRPKILAPAWIPFFCSQPTLSLSRQCATQSINTSQHSHFAPVAHSLLWSHVCQCNTVILNCPGECAAPIPTMSIISLKLKTTSLTMVYKVHYLDPYYLCKHKFYFLIFVHSAFIILPI